MVRLPLGGVARQHAAAKLRGLYVLIDPQQTGGRDPLWVARQALEGGATALQLRDKLRDKGDSLPLAQRLVQLCRDYDATCIINDHADLAVASGAHGVHVGQHDLPVALAKAVLKPWQIVGSSNALLEEAIASFQDGADYIAVGAMFSSTSKDNTRPAGPETLRKVREVIPAGGPPLIAIGGIDKENVWEVAKAGADGIAVISAVTLAEDPARAAEDLLRAFLSVKG
jgi:thiamine-phosphate pyrophosphorylase